MFLTGIGYALFKIFVLGVRYGPTSAMLMTMAVVIFMVGLVSEQVAQLRFDRRIIVSERIKSEPLQIPHTNDESKKN
jgi:hypothetical protein